MGFIEVLDNGKRLVDAHIALFVQRYQAIGIFFAVLGLQLIPTFFSEVCSDGVVIDALKV